MARRQRREVPRDLARAAERFVRWRRSRVVGERIPERLWNCAVDLAGRYGVSRTATVPPNGLLPTPEACGHPPQWRGFCVADDVCGVAACRVSRRVRH